MPATPWSVIYNKLPQATRDRIEARNRVLTQLLERYAEEREASAEAAPTRDATGSRRRVTRRLGGGKRKRVECFGHGVLNDGPHHRTPWQDVWLRWKGSDRRVYRAAPCVQSYDEAVFGLLSAEADLQCDTDPENRVRQEANVAAHRATIACLDAHQYHATEGPYSNVSTWTRFVDRAEAERMLAHLMEAHYGVKNPKFVWRRHKSRHGPVVQHSFMPGDDVE